MRKSIILASFPDDSVPETRPRGGLNFASTLGDIPEQVHTFNEPYSPGLTGECDGIRSAEIQPAGWQPGANTWVERDQYDSMNRRLGIKDDDE